MNSVENFYVKTLELGGLGAALAALRLPFSKECRSDVNFNLITESEIDLIQYRTAITLDPKDIELMNTLLKRGDEHAKALRGIVVWCEINAPRYWWQEFNTYKIGCEGLSSESTMHVECKGLSGDDLVKAKEELSEGHMQKRVIMLNYQTLRRIYNQRVTHRLPQWQTFCKWIKTLPYSKELIVYGLKDVEDVQ